MLVNVPTGEEKTTESSVLTTCSQGGSQLCALGAAPQVKRKLNIFYLSILNMVLFTFYVFKIKLLNYELTT